MSAAHTGVADITCVGETMVMVVAEDGSAIGAHTRSLMRPGGAESNVAAVMALLGHDVRWVSRVGADPLGRLILDALAADGVDVSSVATLTTHPTGVFFKNPAPEGTTVHYYRAGSAASTLDAAAIALIAERPSRILHLSGITPALGEGPRALSHAILNREGLRGELVSFDVNYRPAVWNRPAAQELLEDARRADIVFVGRDEAEALWGTARAEDIRALLSEVPILVVKDGAVEAVEFSGSEVVRVPARSVPVADVVGAGDSFAAGWLAGYLRGFGSGDRLRLGHYVASQTVQVVSDRPELDTPEASIAAALNTPEFSPMKGN